MPILTTDSANIYYEIHGQGQPLILIGGYTVDHLWWSPVLDELAQHYQVVIFDNRATGETTDDSRPLTAEIMAQDVTDLINKLALNKPHILGHSMGGNIAQCIATIAPEKIRKLILVTTSAKWRQATLIGLSSMLDMFAARVDFDIIFKENIAWIYGEAFLADAHKVELLKQTYLANKHPPTIESIQRQFNVLEQFDGRRYLDRISSSTLIIHGNEDIASLPFESEFMAQRIPQTKLIKMPCGHAVNIEMPAEFNANIISFLQ